MLRVYLIRNQSVNPRRAIPIPVCRLYDRVHLRARGPPLSRVTEHYRPDSGMAICPHHLLFKVIIRGRVAQKKPLMMPHNLQHIPQELDRPPVGTGSRPDTVLGC